MESKEDLTLSFDILYEILSRSSLQALGRSRVVSKEFNRLTYESLFMNLHSQRTNTISGYFIQSERRNKHFTTFVSAQNDNLNSQLELNFLPGFIKIEASTKQGILLCNDDNRYRIPKYYVCKPSTRQWQQIPNPKTRFTTQAIGMIVLRSNPTLHYKIVRFSRHKSRNPNSFYQYPVLKCEVFDSKTWAWKLLKDVNWCLVGLAPAVSACGSLHWLTYDRSNIISFHENKESCSLISLPEIVYEIDLMKVVEYEGKLALMCMGQEKKFMELWVMENYGQKLWKKRQTMSVEALRREAPHPTLFALYNAEVALVMEVYKVIFYNFKSGSTSIAGLENHFDGRGVFPFQSDFEPINLMGESRRSNSRPRTSLTKYIGHFRLSPTSAFLFMLFVFTFLCVT